jgi:hypothetical protein
MPLCFFNHITFTLYVVWFNIWLIWVLCIDKLQNDSYDTKKKTTSIGIKFNKTPTVMCSIAWMPTKLVIKI